MSEDPLSRRLRRWSQWQTQLQAARRGGSRHWSASVGAGQSGFAKTAATITRDSISPRPTAKRPLREPAARATRIDSRPIATSDLRSGVEVESSLGRYWHLSRSLEIVWPGSSEFVATSMAQFPHNQVGETPRHRGQHELARFIETFPRQTLFLDLETCGLAGSAIFLAGLIQFDDGELKLKQLWARNHAEERGVIGALREIIGSCTLVVTFNGKSFDWPQVRDRATLHTGIVDGAIKPLDHYDLLHHARRTYGKRFGNCKLQTLERHVCGRYRQADIPGDQIPAVYAEYVRTGDEHLVQPILHHNALDLVTLLQLAITIAEIQARRASE